MTNQNKGKQYLHKADTTMGSTRSRAHGNERDYKPTQSSRESNKSPSNFTTSSLIDYYLIHGTVAMPYRHHKKQSKAK